MNQSTTMNSPSSPPEARETAAGTAGRFERWGWLVWGLGLGWIWAGMAVYGKVDPFFPVLDALCVVLFLFLGVWFYTSKSKRWKAGPAPWEPSLALLAGFCALAVWPIQEWLLAWRTGSPVWFLFFRRLLAWGAGTALLAQFVAGFIPGILMARVAGRGAAGVALLGKALGGGAVALLLAPLCISRLGAPQLCLLGGSALVAGTGMAALGAFGRKPAPAVLGVLGLALLAFGLSPGPSVVRQRLRRWVAEESRRAQVENPMVVVEGVPPSVLVAKPLFSDIWSAGGCATARLGRSEAASPSTASAPSIPSTLSIPSTPSTLSFNHESFSSDSPFDEDRDAPALKQAIESVPYHLRYGGTAAILNPDMGRLAAMAAACGQRRIRVFAPPSSLARALAKFHDHTFDGWPPWKGVVFLPENPIPYLSRQTDRYDVIQIGQGHPAAPLGSSRPLPPLEFLSPAAMALYWERLKDKGCLSIMSGQMAFSEEREMAVDLCRRLAAVARRNIGGSGADRLMVLGWGADAGQDFDARANRLADAPWRAAPEKSKKSKKSAAATQATHPLFPIGEVPRNLSVWHIILSRDAFSSEALTLARGFCADTGGAPLLMPGMTPQGALRTVFMADGAPGPPRQFEAGELRVSKGAGAVVLLALLTALVVGAFAVWESRKNGFSYPSATILVGAALALGAAGGLGARWMNDALLGSMAHAENASFVLLAGLAAGAALALCRLSRTLPPRKPPGAPLPAVFLMLVLGLFAAAVAGGAAWLPGAILPWPSVAQSGAVFAVSALGAAAWTTYGGGCLLRRGAPDRQAAVDRLALTVLFSGFVGWGIWASFAAIGGSAARGGLVLGLAALAGIGSLWVSLRGQGFGAKKKRRGK